MRQAVIRASKPIPPADLWAQLDTLRAAVSVPDSDPAPGRSFTIYDYAARYSISRQTAAEQLKRLADTGKLATGMKPALAANGRRMAVRCYWVPEGGDVHGRVCRGAGR